MKNAEIKKRAKQAHDIATGRVAAYRVSKIVKQPDGSFKEIPLDPEEERAKKARAFAARTRPAEIRHELDLTQAAFADLLGVPLPTLRRWEQTGKVSSQGKTLLKIATISPETLEKAQLVEL